MRSFLLGMTLAACLPAAAGAQARFGLAAGVTGGTALVNDRIFQDIHLTQQLAPTVTLSGSLPVSPRERAGLEIALAFFGSHVVESGFPTISGPSYRTLSVSGGVDGPLFGPLRYRAGAGVLKYLVSREGIFLDGGPTLVTLTGGLDLPLRRFGPWQLVTRLRYDYQRFNTRSLQLSGFSRSKDVHRLGLGLGVTYTRP
jgi:opacity protein-like surface antigen